MSSIAFVRNDGSANVDPFRYGCKLHEVANLLLTNESICIVTQGYEELPSLVHWLGADNFHELLRTGKLQFTLLPSQPFFSQEKDRELRLLWLQYGEGLDALNSLEGRLERLKSACSHYLVPDGFSMPDELGTEIAARTTVKPGLESREYHNLLSNSVQAFLQKADHSLLPTGLEGLPQDVTFDADGTVRIRDNVHVDQCRCRCELLLQALREILVAYEFGAPLVHVSSLVGALGDAAEAAKVTDNSALAFNDIIDLHQLPLVDHGVYTGHISADAIIQLRRGKHGTRFRQWLSATDAASVDSKQIVANYADAISELHRPSLFWPGIRLGTSCAVGVVATFTGVFLSVADFVYSNFVKKVPWQPNFFIRGDYERTVSQRAARTQINVPIDVGYLLARDYQLSAFHLCVDQRVEIKLDRGGSEKINVTYEPDELVYWKEFFPTLVASQPGREFLLDCSLCQRRSRLISPGKQVSLPKCGHCKAPLL